MTLLTRKLGPLEVSVVGLGTSNFGGRLKDLSQAQCIVDTALGLGVNFIDTADIYGDNNPGSSEEWLGQIIGPRRNKVVLATKFGLPTGQGRGASGRYVLQACEASLKRLNTEWIDLYQLHYSDPDVPIAETLRALHSLVQQGKVRCIGCCNLQSWQITAARRAAEESGLTQFICAQDEYSLLIRRADHSLIPALKRFDMPLIPYYPLASGLLTGKYNYGAPLPPGRLRNDHSLAHQFINQRNWTVLNALSTFAKQRGHTLLQLAMSWLASRSLVASIIAGAMTPEQVTQNVAAAEWALTPEELAEVDRITA